MQSSRIGRGLDPRMLGTGLGILGLGLVMTYLGWFTQHGVRIGPLPVPLAIVGPLVLLVGVAASVFAFHQEKCLPCNATLETTLVHFPLDWTSRVVAAVMNGDPGALSSAPQGRAYEAHVKVMFHPCPSCKSVALVEVAAFEPARRPVVPKCALEGARVAPIAELLSEREAWAERRAA
jgi:hypothetical protein